MDDQPNLDAVIDDFARFWGCDRAMASQIVLAGIDAQLEPLRAELERLRRSLPGPVWRFVRWYVNVRARLRRR